MPDFGGDRTLNDMAAPAPIAVDLPEEEMPSSGAVLPSSPCGALGFEAIYEQYAAFVWRSARRLGVEDAAAEDVVQDVFIVVHRRLPEFERRSALRTWLFGIVLGVVRNHRRSIRRKRIDESAQAIEALERMPSDDNPDEHAERAHAVKLLHALLDTLDDDKREVFVMAELEQMRGTEIAEATGQNLNTVYARLKAARQAFNQAVARLRAQHEWRPA